MRCAIFSGRFDPCHLGHVRSIVKIAKRFDHVFVPILDYPGREVCADRVLLIFKDFFNTVFSLHNVTFLINWIHFGKITLEEYLSFIKAHIGEDAQTMYLSGNQQVIDHMKEIGVANFGFYPRYMDHIYTGTIMKERIKDSGK